MRSGFCETKRIIIWLWLHISLNVSFQRTRARKRTDKTAEGKEWTEKLRRNTRKEADRQDCRRKRVDGETEKEHAQGSRPTRLQKEKSGRRNWEGTRARKPTDKTAEGKEWTEKLRRNTRKEADRQDCRRKRVDGETEKEHAQGSRPTRLQKEKSGRRHWEGTRARKPTDKTAEGKEWTEKLRRKARRSRKQHRLWSRGKREETKGCEDWRRLKARRLREREGEGK